MNETVGSTTVTITWDTRPKSKKVDKNKCVDRPHILNHPTPMVFGVWYPFCPACGSHTSW